MGMIKLEAVEERRKRAAVQRTVMMMIMMDGELMDDSSG